MLPFKNGIFSNIAIAITKRSKVLIPKRMQRGLRVITLQGAIEKSPILLSQYWKNEGLVVTIIISYFSGCYNIFADCTSKNANLDLQRFLNMLYSRRYWGLLYSANYFLPFSNILSIDPSIITFLIFFAFYISSLLLFLIYLVIAIALPTI